MMICNPHWSHDHITFWVDLEYIGCYRWQSERNIGNMLMNWTWTPKVMFFFCLADAFDIGFMQLLVMKPDLEKRGFGEPESAMMYQSINMEQCSGIERNFTISITIIME